MNDIKPVAELGWKANKPDTMQELRWKAAWHFPIGTHHPDAQGAELESLKLKLKEIRDNK